MILSYRSEEKEICAVGQSVRRSKSSKKPSDTIVGGGLCTCYVPPERSLREREAEHYMIARVGMTRDATTRANRNRGGHRL